MTVITDLLSSPRLKGRITKLHNQVFSHKKANSDFACHKKTTRLRYINFRHVINAITHISTIWHYSNSLFSLRNQGRIFCIPVVAEAVLLIVLQLTKRLRGML